MGLPELKFEVFEGYIATLYRGPDSLEISKSITLQCIKACEKHGVVKFIVEAFMETELSVLENYSIGQMLSKIGFTPSHRAAWVELNPDIINSTEFAETVILNQGFIVKLFGDKDAAVEWIKNA